jgi:hypothetical protein
MKKLSYDEKVLIIHDSIVSAMAYEEISYAHNVSK